MLGLYKMLDRKDKTLHKHLKMKDIQNSSMQRKIHKQSHKTKDKSDREETCLWMTKRGEKRRLYITNIDLKPETVALNNTPSPRTDTKNELHQIQNREHIGK